MTLAGTTVEITTMTRAISGAAVRSTSATETRQFPATCSYETSICRAGMSATVNTRCLEKRGRKEEGELERRTILLDV